ncbi:disease resistance protein Roq1-like isoform X1 [Malus domestica]|uniref:disease resistance protein Roq1-like isoform X1 n=1 Tax=Malus domestica TaxID=3750 RepID=UPI0010AB02A0|nr:putative disease resistance protein At3g14460 isoform X1 [Malus domestica]
MKGISSLFPHTEPAMQEQDLISHARKGDVPASLKTLYVNKCEVLHKNRASNTLNVESLRGSLEKLTINGCPGLSLLLESTETLPSLQKLDIDSVGGKELLAQMVHNSNRLQSLTLYKCYSPLSFPTNGLPTTLTSLSITDCKKLEFLSREMMAKLTSLRSLRLSNSCERKGLSICNCSLWKLLSSLDLLLAWCLLIEYWRSIKTQISTPHFTS